MEDVLPIAFNCKLVQASNMVNPLIKIMGLDAKTSGSIPKFMKFYVFQPIELILITFDKIDIVLFWITLGKLPSKIIIEFETIDHAGVVPRFSNESPVKRLVHKELITG